MRKLWILLIPALLVACTTVEVTQSDFFHPGYAAMARKALLKLQTTEYRTESVDFFGFDGTHLHGLLLIRADAAATILYFGGARFQLGTEGLKVGENLEAIGVNALLVDYRGYGESAGIPTVESLKSDALAAYDYLTSRPLVTKVPIIVQGSSLGSFIAPFVATHRPVRGLVLEDTAPDLSSWAENFVRQQENPLVQVKISEPLQDESNVENLGKYRGPLLLLAGGNDPVAPPAYARQLLGVSATPKKMRRIYVAQGYGQGAVLEDPGARGAYRNFIKLVSTLPPQSGSGGASGASDD